MKEIVTITISASAKTVWKVLTESIYTKQYMFNCSVECSWILGAPIVWQGNFNGYEAYQKGEIISIEPFKQVTYSTFDPNFGLEDIPENYIHVSYELTETSGTTTLTISNETFDNNSERMAHILQGWNMVCQGIKSVAESVC